MENPQSITFNGKPADFHQFKTPVKRPKSFSLACPDYVDGLTETPTAVNGANFSYEMATQSQNRFELSVYLLNKSKNMYHHSTKGTDYGVTVATVQSSKRLNDYQITLDRIVDSRQRPLQETLYTDILDSYMRGMSIRTKNQTLTDEDAAQASSNNRLHDPEIAFDTNGGDVTIYPLCTTEGLIFETYLRHPSANRRDAFLEQTDKLFDILQDAFRKNAFQVAATYLYAARSLYRIHNQAEDMHADLHLLEEQVGALYTRIDSLLFNEPPLAGYASYVQSLASVLDGFKRSSK